MRLPATESTPEVDLTFADGNKGWIRGPLKYGNIEALFDDIVDHLDAVLEHHQGQRFVIEVDLDDAPSTASQFVRKMLDTLEAHRKKGTAVKVHWFYRADNDKTKRFALLLPEKYDMLVSKPQVSSRK